MSSRRRTLGFCLLLCIPAALSSAAFAQKTDAGNTGAPSTVVATQGSASVTLADIDAFAARIPEKDRAGFFDNPTRLESLILQLLSQKQLADEARKANLDKTPVVHGQMDMATEEVLSRARMENFKAGLKLPDFEQRAHEEYVAHKDTYVVPGDISVQQVLISTKSRDDKEAKALADTVATEAKAHPDQFDALVQKYSDGESKAGNGLVTGVTKATYGAPFLDAAKALKKPGDISAPVKTKDGYRVVKLVSRAADKQLAFAEVHDRIVERLKGDYVDKAVKQHVDEIRNQHVEANPALVASLRTRYGTAAPADPVSLDSIGAPSAQP